MYYSVQKMLLIYYVLFLQYKIARYLVRRYPQWAYKPYKPTLNFRNPYRAYSSNDDIEELSIKSSKSKQFYENELNRQFNDNSEMLENLLGEKDFNKKIRDLGIYTGNYYNIIYI